MRIYSLFSTTYYKVDMVYIKIKSKLYFLSFIINHLFISYRFKVVTALLTFFMTFERDKFMKFRHVNILFLTYKSKVQHKGKKEAALEFCCHIHLHIYLPTHQ